MLARVAKRKLLEGVAYTYNWTSIVGALEGVMRYLGQDYPTAYLMGLSGHAFRLDISADDGAAIGPKGPTCIDYNHALRLYSGLGREFAAISASQSDRDYEGARKRALEQIKKSIDRGVPAIAFDLHLPEFGIVVGFDDQQRVLLVDTALRPQVGAVLPYDRWPTTDTGWLLALIPNPKAIAFDGARAEREALRFAVAHAEEGEGGLAATGSYHGLAAWEFWASTLEGEAPASAFGNAYTAQVVQAARRYAGQFLRGMASKYPQAQELSAAAAAYQRAGLVLTRFATLFPFPQGGEIDNTGARRLGAACLRGALAEEQTAIGAIKSILATI